MEIMAHPNLKRIVKMRRVGHRLVVLVGVLSSIMVTVITVKGIRKR